MRYLAECGCSDFPGSESQASRFKGLWELEPASRDQQVEGGPGYWAMGGSVQGKVFQEGRHRMNTPTVFKQVKGCDGEDTGLLPALLTQQGQKERANMPGDRYLLN